MCSGTNMLKLIYVRQLPQLAIKLSLLNIL